MTATATTVWIDWADDLPADDRGPVLYRPTDLPPLDRGEGLRVLDLGRGRYAVESHSEPGRWHRVKVTEHLGRIGASCGCKAGHFARQGRVCAHSAAALTRHLAQEAEYEEMRF